MQVYIFCSLKLKTGDCVQLGDNYSKVSFGEVYRRIFSLMVMLK